MLNWWRRRQHRARVAAFIGLVRAGQDEEALAWSAEHLADQAQPTPPAVRSAALAMHWERHRDDQDRSELARLLAASKASPEIARAWEIIFGLDHALQLSRALSERNPALISKPVLSSGCGSSADQLIHLATAQLACFRPPAGAAPHQRETAVSQVLQTWTSIAELPESLRFGASHLYAWSGLALRQFSRLCQKPQMLVGLPSVENARVLSWAATRWGRDELAAGRLETGRQAYAILEPIIALPQRAETLCRWGLAAISQHPAIAEAWFQFAESQDELQVFAPVFRLGRTLAMLRLGRLSQAQQRLTQTRAETSAEASAAAGDDEVQRLYLAGLTVLAETRDWPTPAPDTAGDEARRQNRALWESVQERLKQLMEQLERQGTAGKSCAALLRGLMQFADRNARITAEDVRAFSAAADVTAQPAARVRLKAVEGALESRSRATEAAVQLVKQGDARALRELQSNILAPLGDAVPASVRAAVILTLWKTGESPNVDVELQQLPSSFAADPLFTEAVGQVTIADRMLQLATRLSTVEGAPGPLPSLEPLRAFDPVVAIYADLALATLAMRRGDWGTAQSTLPTSDDAKLRPWIAYLRFYCAWKLGALADCRSQLTEASSSPMMPRGSQGQRALLSRTLQESLATNDPDGARQRLIEAGGGKLASPTVFKVLMRFVTYLLERRQTQAAQLLLQAVARELPPEPPQELLPLAWACEILTALVAAQAQQFVLCQEASTRVLSSPPPPLNNYCSPQDAERLLAWCRWFRLSAEIGSAARTGTDARQQWNAIQRSVAGQLQGGTEHQQLRPYLDLVSGLMTALSQSAIDDDALQRMNRARQSLMLSRRAEFLDRMLGQLNWRRQTVRDFWAAFKAGDFGLARRIHREELAQALGENLPGDIRAAMLVVDAATGTATPSVLLQRLQLLRQEAEGVSREVFDSIERDLQDREQTQRVTRLLTEAKFPELLQLIEQTVWDRENPNSMPFPVVLAQLYGLFRTRQEEDVISLAGRLVDAARGVPWARDDSLLILGYMQFGQGQTAKATEAFEQVSVSQLHGHDLDRYWAAAQFSNGIALLAHDQHEKAFDAFQSSLAKRGTRADNHRLAPLFIHFGLKSLDTQQGRRARQAFSLMGQCLSENSTEPQDWLFRRLSAFSVLLCDALHEEDVRELGSKQFLSLQPPLDSAPETLSAVMRADLRRIQHIGALCQELRRQRRLESKERLGHNKLLALVTQQVEALDGLSQPEQDASVFHPEKDPVLLTVKGVAELLFGKDQTKALGLIEQAMQLGVRSTGRLAALLAKHRKLIEQSHRQANQALDLFHVYLQCGEIPAAAQQSLVRHDELSALFRLNRNYLPADLVMPEVQSGVSVLCRRLTQTCDFLTSEEAPPDPELQKLEPQLRSLIKQLEQTEAKALELEQSVLLNLATQLQRQIQPIA